MTRAFLVVLLRFLVSSAWSEKKKRESLLEEPTDFLSLLQLSVTKRITNSRQPSPCLFLRLVAFPPPPLWIVRLLVLLLTCPSPLLSAYAPHHQKRPWVLYFPRLLRLLLPSRRKKERDGFSRWEKRAETGTYWEESRRGKIRSREDGRLDIPPGID